MNSLKVKTITTEMPSSNILEDNENCLSMVKILWGKNEGYDQNEKI